ncbi:hypothetical protein D0Z08_13810 [Nocardioides immobilis]|uniref:DUF3558 domain-containing protein n=1 Tax=Nocardioides immobilis TaxID=2049295 RepID=A0A417Y1A4_9ACTN|nr:hypothetical protein [Nocardioides immobilis]RHW26413.1 hypothetical protein D0Z08_13810 [Nocardioides immobilis]
MASLRPFLPAIAVLLLAPVLAACGDDGDEQDNTPPSSSSPSPPESSEPTEKTDATSIAPPTATSATAGAELPAPCDVLTPADVEAAFGVAFGEPSQGGGGYTQQDLVWQSEDCNFEAEDLVEVDFALTGPDDFRQGEFQCPKPTEIVATVTRVRGLDAVEAWWKRDENPPLEATLRVCTESYNFDIELDYEDGVDFQGDPKQQSIALAETVLTNIG